MNSSGSNRRLERMEFVLRGAGAPVQPPDPLRSGMHSRGYLPHIKREGASYFVTFRLSDSLPHAVLLRFKVEQVEADRALGSTATRDEIEEVNRALRRKVEQYLDRGIGACHLRRPEIADLIVEALHFADGGQYVLDDWVVMPNHVHVILWPLPNFTLSEILRGRKTYTAREANLILGRRGKTFWQRESYDHWIRDDEEKSRIRRYIRMNPVKAGLCRTPEEWKWSSAWSGWRNADC